MKFSIKYPVNYSILTLSLTSLLIGSGCARSDDPFSTAAYRSSHGSEIAQELKVTVEDTNRISVAPTQTSSQAVQVEFTVNAEPLFNQEFLYGVDLQYSSDYIQDLDLYNQSLVMQLVPARFQVNGDELLLVANNRHLYPSDVNHPDQVLTRFKILKRNKHTLTLSAGRASTALSQLFLGPSHGAGIQDYWVRSFEYIPQGNYILQQSTVVLEEGTIAEIMESIFPRSTLKPGKDFTVFPMDPDSPIGASSGIPFRFRMLPGEALFEGEKKVAYAQHFDLSPSGEKPSTLSFYVTRNIPEKMMEPIRLGVEAWNRYFYHFDGFKRPVIQFKGRLPEGIHLGDPRFNVISWDSRTIAGAAYESQSADPATGVQSHSLIYLPAAWIQIGKDYWKTNPDPQPQAPVATSSLGRTKSRIGKLACFRDLKEQKQLLQSGELVTGDAEVFGVQLLKQTLFHEVGHALGLAHNFKGSLAYHKSQAHSPFSTSIMDYNDYEIERAAFDSIHSEDGPLLEYDRQALSAIYDRGQNIQASDPILPACNDAEADEEIDGVDPLCNRYDLEDDPTRSVETAYQRIVESHLENDLTLAEAILRTQSILTTQELLNQIGTESELNRFVEEISDLISGTLEFYFNSRKGSLQKTAANNVKSLLVFRPGVLPPGYNETEMRNRAFTGITQALRLKKLPPSVSAAVQEVGETFANALSQTPFGKSITPDQLTHQTNALQLKLKEKVDLFESHPAKGLAKMRTALYLALERHDLVPYFFAKTDAKSVVDYELKLAGLLFRGVSPKSGNGEIERLAAALSLRSFKNHLPQILLKIEELMDELEKEVQDAQDSQSREKALSLMEILLS